ncbi:MAG: hypothetical protein J6Q65_01375 [Lentisphaeria bacterium]|nr:hypothetical protein [Lentisphaeria bacterium]
MKEYAKIDPASLVQNIRKSRLTLGFIIAFIATIVFLGGLSVSFIGECFEYGSIHPDAVKKQLEKEKAAKEKEAKQKAEAEAAKKRQEELVEKQKAEAEAEAKKKEEEKKIDARKKADDKKADADQDGKGAVSGDPYADQKIDPNSVKGSDAGFDFNTL